jgi:NAD(P)-dependent dehydrogenase (short-subunit alcohol dehydrogenase family)
MIERREEQTLDLVARRVAPPGGGTSGIGLASAMAAVEAGATVVVARSNRERADDALAQLPEDAQGYVVDLSQEKESFGVTTSSSRGEL